MNKWSLTSTSLLLLFAGGAWLFARPPASVPIPPRDESAARVGSHQPALLIAPASQASPNPHQIVDWIKVEPNTIKVEVQTTVTVTAKIGADPTLIPESVNLFRYDERGQLVGALGRMYDDGTHGDIASGDYIFTTQLALNESQPVTALLRASVAYRGLLLRVISEPAVFFVQTVTTAEQTLSNLADELEAGDIEGAVKRYSSSPLNRETLTGLDGSRRAQLARDLRDARLVKETGRRRIYQVPYVDKDGQARETEISLAKNALGEWIIISW